MIVDHADYLQLDVIQDLFEQPLGMVIVCKRFNPSVKHPVAPPRKQNTRRGVPGRAVPVTTIRSRTGKVIRSR